MPLHHFVLTPPIVTELSYVMELFESILDFNTGDERSGSLVNRIPKLSSKKLGNELQSQVLSSSEHRLIYLNTDIL